jgi:hypothetical protein
MRIDRLKPSFVSYYLGGSMTKSLNLVPVLLLGLAVPGPLQSQQPAESPPPTVIISSFKCDWTRIADIVAEAEAQLPYWEEQRAAGAIMETGVYIHSYADEWNVMRYIVAPTMESAVSANAAANGAFAEANPASTAIIDGCPAHRDNFYLAGATAGSESSATGGNPTLMMTFMQCETSRVGDVMAEFENLVIPAYQALVNEGKIRSAASFVHYWADEWNVGFGVVAEDIPSFLTAAQEANSRIGERPVVAEACPVHKDGFYTVGPRTGG